MARNRFCSTVGLVFMSWAVFACSASSDADDGSVPEYVGALPGAGPSGLQAPANGSPSGSPSTAPSGAMNGANPEAVGANGGVPINGTPASNTGSGGAAPAAMAGSGGAAGGAMTGVDPATGAGGSAMPPGLGGNGSLPPNEPAPPVVGEGCGAGAIFCEDFDAIALGAVQGTINGLRPERSVSIVDEPGRGRVLQVQAGSTYGNKNGVFLDNFTAPGNSHFGRAFISVSQFPNAGGDHWVIVEATANGAGEAVRPVGGQFSRWAPGSDGPSAGDWTDWEQSDAATVPGAWECVEWQINGANGGNDMVLWVNGLEVQPLDRPNFSLPAINTLWFGWVVFQNAQPPAYDVRFDDVVLSTQRVGCDG